MQIRLLPLYLGGNGHIYVDILGGLSGLGSLSGNVHIFVDILGGLSGLRGLDGNFHIFWTFWGVQWPL